MHELQFPMAIRRLTLRRGDGSWQVEEESVLEGTLPAPLDLPGSDTPVVGAWWEAVDADGKVLYRERLEDVSDPHMELFEEDGSISRVEHPTEVFAEHEPLMELLVPDLPELADLRFVTARSTGKTVAGRPEVKQDVEVLRVARGPRTRRGTAKS